MIAAIKRIKKLKKQFPELRGNDFVFATKGTKRMHVRGHKAFERIAKKLNLENITAGKIRKLAATNNALAKDNRKRKL